MSAYKIVGGDGKEYGPISSEQLRQWVAEGRANGNTLVWTEGGVWKKLSAYPEFGDVVRPVAPPALGTSAPSAAPVPAGGVAPAVLPAQAGGLGRPAAEVAKGLLQGPAIGLLILGILGIPMSLLGIVMSGASSVSALPMGHGMPPEMEELMRFLNGPVGIITNLLSLFCSLLILFGGLRMMALRNYGLCLAAAILAVIPCFNACCCIGIPVGIWALVMLTKAEVKAAFS